MALIKSEQDIKYLRVAGQRHARVLSELAEMVAPGVTTGQLDAYARERIEKEGDIASFLNYQPYGASYPYPAGLCVSVNDEIVHGIPGDYALKEGDIVSMDLGVTHNGLITDAAITVPVGHVDKKTEKLLAMTKAALYAGIDAAVFGNRIGDISYAIGELGGKHGYGVVRELGGHGVGHAVHEEPYIANFGKKGTGPLLKPGMVLALEPMFTMGQRGIIISPDGYTIHSQDGSLSAHFEHTILITETYPEILTEIQ